MKYHLSFIITVQLFITSCCNAMEKQEEPILKILTTITAMTDPEQVFCFPPNLVAIMGKNGCSLYDYSTDGISKEIKKFNKDPFFLHVAQHPKQPLLAIRNVRSGRDDVSIYDIATQDKIKIWEKISQGFCGSPIFNPIDNTILLEHTRGNRIDSFNYQTKSNEASTFHKDSFSDVIFHPTEQKYITVSNGGNYTNTPGTITIKGFNDDSFIPQVIQIPEFISNCHYSPDGSLIAVINIEGCCIVNPTSGLYEYLTEKGISSMTFFPSSCILATLHREGNKLWFWNTKTLQLILTIPLAPIKRPVPLSSDRIAFSHDRTKMIIAFPDKCVVFEVPFEELCDTLYQPGTKEKCIFTNLILQHYLHDGETILQELRYLLIQYLLASSQYSLTNH